MRLALRLALVIALLALAAPARGDVLAAGDLRLSPIGDFANPVYVTSPPGDPARIFVVEQGGTIALVKNGAVAPQKFLDIRSQVHSGGEQGLLSMAFAPDYATSGRFYVYYTDAGACTGGSCDNRIDELTRSSDPDRADPASDREVISFPHRKFSNHNGGQLQFGPDGYLYAGLGDGGSGGDPDCNAQNLGSLLGKIVRIDPRATVGGAYRVPPGNPFAATMGARAEVWAYGLRNPWRFSFDSLTGDLTIGDVGQGAHEEIDFAPRSAGGAGPGANYGWNVREGNSDYSRACGTSNPPPGYVAPVITYDTHVGGTCAVTGGYVVRDLALPALRGRYVYADECAGAIRSAVLSPGAAADDAGSGLVVADLSSFGTDAACRVYVAKLDGPVYRLSSTSAGPQAGCATSPSPAGNGGDRRGPVVSRLTMLRRRFAPGRQRRGPGRGTAFRYTLSERATVTIAIDARRRRHGRIHFATLVRRRLRAGRQSTRYGGFWRRGALPAGRYRATLRARDSAGNLSRPRRITFTVLP